MSTIYRTVAALMLALCLLPSQSRADLSVSPFVQDSSIGIVAPMPALTGPSAPPNRLTVQATLDKIKHEAGPGWVAAEGVPSDVIRRNVGLRQAELDRGLVKSIVVKDETRRKIIALTFDDGPHAGFTTELTSELKQLNVPATFFLVGKQVEKFPDLAKEIVADGFSVGNHTYDHVCLLKVPTSYVPTEILACENSIRNATGITSHLFRPPGGEFDPNVARTVEQMGYHTVLWTDDPGDFAKPGADVILKRVLAKAKPGGIILLHDGIDQTLDVLPQIVSTLRDQGFEFVTVDDLIADRDQSERHVRTAKLETVRYESAISRQPARVVPLTTP